MKFFKNLAIKVKERRIKKIQREIESLREESFKKHVKKKEPGIRDTLKDPKTHKYDLHLKTKFVKKDPTFFLLFLIVLVSAGLLATTSLYQVKLKNLNNEFTAKVVEVDSLKQDLLEKENSLNELEQSLEVTSQRGEELEEVFEAERSEKQKLNDQIKLLKSEKADLQSEIDSLKKTISELKDENDALEAQLAQQ